MRVLKSSLRAGMVLAGLAIVLVVVPACQTVKGLGQDVKNAGEAGERAIDGEKK